MVGDLFRQNARKAQIRLALKTARALLTITGKSQKQVLQMRPHSRMIVLSGFLAVGGMLSGCFSSSKEVREVPVMQAPPTIVQVPAPVVVSSDPSQTSTSTSWGNGAVVQKQTTNSVDGAAERHTTTTWNNDPSMSTTTSTTTTPPY
jgi:hypothetical protein